MGIQQKLHTKLVQKLILTPSLQQAIKLLPMSTLELSDLLNQEMVENPMLEEVPTEELQPAETQQTQEKTEPEQQANKTDTWDDQDYEYFFGDYLDDGYRPRAPQEVKELPPIENTLDRKSTRLNSSHSQISYAVFCLKKKTNNAEQVPRHCVGEVPLALRLRGDSRLPRTAAALLYRSHHQPYVLVHAVLRRPQETSL